MRVFSWKARLLCALLALGAAFGMPLQPAVPQEQAPYRYLAIGNSITRHPVYDYWWDEMGMAASEVSRDYVHLVEAYLRERHGAVETDIVSFSEWEITQEFRKDTYVLIDPCLTGDVDLITVQLSENLSPTYMLRYNYEELIKYIRNKCPQAQIVLVDDFWSDSKSGIKREIAQKMELPFADLSAIRGDPAYQSSLGATVYDSAGQPHVIDNEFVARHPGDAGMAAIAEAIISQLKALE